MFHLVDVVQNRAGDGLQNYQIKLKNRTTGLYQALYSDASGTAISTVSGIANTAKTDENGEYSLFVDDGRYDLEIYQPDGVTLARPIVQDMHFYGLDAKDAAVAAAATATTQAGAAATSAATATTQAGIATTQANRADERADDAEAAAQAAAVARDVAIAAGVQYPTAAAAVAALADGAFGSYLDASGLPVWGQRSGAGMVPIPGPWISDLRVGGVATRAALKALPTFAGAKVTLTEAGREGVFVFRSGNFSSKITADTQEGLYVKADAVAASAGAWVRQFDNAVNVKWFGAVGDGVTVDTVAFNAARDALAGRGGTIYVPAGTYPINFQLINEASRNVHLTGDQGATLLRSATDGGWAMWLPNWVFASQPYTFPSISNVAFDGTFAGVARRSNGLNLPRRCNLHNVSFQKCAVGLVSHDNYYGAYTNCNFYINFCDALFGSFAAGSNTLTGALDGNNAPVSVVVTPASYNAEGHSGNKVLMNWKHESSTFGIICGAGSDFTPRLHIIKPTMEACKTALHVAAGRVTVQSPWFEANGTTTTTRTFAGLTIEECDVEATRRATGNKPDVGGTILISDDAHLPLIKVKAGGSVIVDDAVLYSPPVVQAGGGLIMDRIRADVLSIPHLINRPSGEFGNGRGIWCFGHTPSGLIRSGGVPGGKVLISERFEGANDASLSPRLTIAGTGTRTWGTVGGIWPEQKYLNWQTQATFGFNLEVSSLLTQHRDYVFLMTVRSAEDAEWEFTNLAGFMTQFSNRLTTPAGKLTTIVAQSRWTGTPGLAPRIRVLDITAGSAVQFHSLQLVEFPTRELAAEFAASRQFYEVEE